jgi:hypothetical protein
MTGNMLYLRLTANSNNSPNADIFEKIGFTTVEIENKVGKFNFNAIVRRLIVNGVLFLRIMIIRIIGLLHKISKLLKVINFGHVRYNLNHHSKSVKNGKCYGTKGGV